MLGDRRNRDNLRMTDPSSPEPRRIGPPPRKRRTETHASRRLFLLAVVLIALGGGGLVAWDWLSRGRGGEPFVRPLPQTVNKTAQEPPSALTPPSPVPAPPAQPSGPPSVSPLPQQDLAARLAALEARLAQATVSPTPSPQPAPPNPADAQIAQLQARIATLENTVAIERTRADRGQAEATSAVKRLQATVRAAGALARLRTNLERGYPFEREYDEASAAMAADSASRAGFASLRQWAESGIPTRGALREALETQGGEIVRAAVLESADTWWQAIITRIKALIVVRPTPDGDVPAAGTPDGDRAPAIVARAEVRLRDGDVPGAVSELSALSGAAADTAQAWIAAARARISADETLAALEEALQTIQPVSTESSPAAAPTPAAAEKPQEPPAIPEPSPPPVEAPSSGSEP